LIEKSKMKKKSRKFPGRARQRRCSGFTQGGCLSAAVCGYFFQEDVAVFYLALGRRAEVRDFGLVKKL